MAAAYQAPPSMGFSRQEYWSGVPLPSPPSVHNGVHIFPFYKDISHVGLGPTHKTSFYLNYIFKSPALKYSHSEALRLEIQHMNLGET